MAIAGDLSAAGASAADALGFRVASGTQARLVGSLHQFTVGAIADYSLDIELSRLGGSVILSYTATSNDQPAPPTDTGFAQSVFLSPGDYLLRYTINPFANATNGGSARVETRIAATFVTGAVRNEGFAGASLNGWSASGPGRAEAVELAPGDGAAQLTTGSPVTLAQAVDPSELQPLLGFDYRFATTSGTLEVYLGGTLLDTIAAPSDLAANFTHRNVMVPEALFGQGEMPLEFRFDGPTGSQVLLDNVAFNVPEPGAFGLAIVAAVGLLGGRGRRTTLHHGA